MATLVDIYTREIVGWAISTRHNTELIIEALNNALSKYEAPEIGHSDQGSEYRSHQYLQTLEANHIKPSMSQKARPWENGYQESLYSEFKLELGHPECYTSFGVLVEAVAQQIYTHQHQVCENFSQKILYLRQNFCYFFANLIFRGLYTAK